MLTKEKSLQIKGIAIIMMLFLHLFCYTKNIELCQNYIYINGIPLAQLLTRATYPVPFFLILGGYGLYILYRRQDNRRVVRIFKLYLHYWTILFVFLIIGYYINPNLYPGTLHKFFINISTYETTYNTEMWFLLPYSILSIASVWVFRIFDKCKTSVVVVGTLIIHLITSYGISRYADSFFYSHYGIYNLWLVLHILFHFSLGAMAAKSDLFGRIKEHFDKSNIKYKFYIPYLLMLSLVIINCVFKYNYFYAFLMILCLCLIDFSDSVKQLLSSFGRQSMNMWMIHSWLCYYLFHDFVYSFKYPVLILVVLVFFSYYIGVAIDAIIKPFENKLLTYRQRKEQIQL